MDQVTPVGTASAPETATLGATTAVAANGRRRFDPWWLVVVAGIVWFALPLVATLQSSFRSRVPFAGYANTLADPSFWSTLTYSIAIALITIACSVALMVPTTYWVRLRLPRARPLMEALTLLPFVVPPVVLVFGLIRAYAHDPLPLTSTDLGSSALLVAAYVVLSLPYMYRSVDAGLRAIDSRSLTEAAQSLGAGTPLILWRIILPNIRVAVLGGAFLTFAIVMGEFTIAAFLVRPAFGPYLYQVGRDKIIEPPAVTLISLGLTWLAMGAIALIGRRRRAGVPVVAVR